MRTLVMMFIFVIPGVVGFAEEPRPLPEFFVVAQDDSQVSSMTLSAEQQWILVHLKPECSQCRYLLSYLDRQSGEDLGRVVLVVESDRQIANKMMARYPNLSQTPWFLDPNGNARAAMNVRGTPVSFGMRTGIVEWTMAGTPGEPQIWNSVISTWIQAEGNPDQ